MHFPKHFHATLLIVSAGLLDSCAARRNDKQQSTPEASSESNPSGVDPAVEKALLGDQAAEFNQLGLKLVEASKEYLANATNDNPALRASAEDMVNATPEKIAVGLASPEYDELTEYAKEDAETLQEEKAAEEGVPPSQHLSTTTRIVGSIGAGVVATMGALAFICGQKLKNANAKAQIGVLQPPAQAKFAAYDSLRFGGIIAGAVGIGGVVAANMLLAEDKAEAKYIATLSEVAEARARLVPPSLGLFERCSGAMARGETPSSEKPQSPSTPPNTPGASTGSTSGENTIEALLGEPRIFEVPKRVKVGPKRKHKQKTKLIFDPKGKPETLPAPAKSAEKRETPQAPAKSNDDEDWGDPNAKPERDTRSMDEIMAGRKVHVETPRSNAKTPATPPVPAKIPSGTGAAPAPAASSATKVQKGDQPSRIVTPSKIGGQPTLESSTGSRLKPRTPRKYKPDNTGKDGKPLGSIKEGDDESELP